MKQFILSILIITFSISSYSQTGIDSITYQNRVDSTSFLTVFRKVLASHPYYNFLKTADVRPEIKRIPYSADTLFYVILGLFFYFAIVKTLFERYVNNLVALFLRLTLRQQQLREQLLQAPFPSLLLNILFLLSAGLYASLLLQYYSVQIPGGFWLQTTYCILLLALIYTGKYIFLKSAGWIFNVSKTTDTYLFIVFIVNKMLGILLIPFLLLIVFQDQNVRQVFITLSLIMIIGLLLYRLALSYRPIRNQININLFHFFIYLCAFEIAPLLLIYKVLFAVVEKTH